MLSPQEFAKLEPNAREELITKFNLVRSGFGSDVRGNEVFMFDGFTKLDLINVKDDTNTQQNEGGVIIGDGAKKEDRRTKEYRQRKALSLPSKE